MTGNEVGEAPYLRIFLLLIHIRFFHVMKVYKRLVGNWRRVCFSRCRYKTLKLCHFAKFRMLFSAVLTSKFRITVVKENRFPNKMKLSNPGCKTLMTFLNTGAVAHWGLHISSRSGLLFLP